MQVPKGIFKKIEKKYLKGFRKSTKGSREVRNIEQGTNEL
jgi:hypothetical protein